MALEFNGTDTRIERIGTPSLHFSGVISLGAWFKVNNVANTQVILFKWRAYAMRISGGKVWCILLTENIGWGEVYEIGDISAGERVYVAWTYDGACLRGYINDEQTMDIPHLGGDLALHVVNHEVYIGGTPTWGWFLDGIIGEIRVYNNVLSLEENKIIYESRGSDNIVDELVARWLMNEKPDGTISSGADSIIDISGNNNHGTPHNSPIYRASPVKIIKPIMHI